MQYHPTSKTWEPLRFQCFCGDFVVLFWFFIRLFVDRKKPQYVAQTPGCFEGGFVLVLGGCDCGFSFFFFSFCGLWMKQFKRESSSGKCASSVNVFWCRLYHPKVSSTIWFFS